MNISKIFLALFLLCHLCIGVGGCVSHTEPQATPCRSAQMAARDIGLRSSTLRHSPCEIGSVSGGKKTQPSGEPNVGNGGFRSALVYSLEVNGLATYATAAKFSISARIIQSDQWHMLVHYHVIDRTNGKVVFNRNISTHSQATLYTLRTNASLAYILAAKELIARRNIETFLGELDSVFLTQEKKNAQTATARNKPIAHTTRSRETHAR